MCHGCYVSFLVAALLPISCRKLSLFLSLCWWMSTVVTVNFRTFFLSWTTKPNGKTVGFWRGGRLRALWKPPLWSCKKMLFCPMSGCFLHIYVYIKFIIVCWFLGHHFLCSEKRASTATKKTHISLWPLKETRHSSWSRKMKMDLNSLGVLIQFLSWHDFTSDWVHQGWTKVDMRWSYLQLCGIFVCLFSVSNGGERNNEICESLKLDRQCSRLQTPTKITKRQGHGPSLFCKNTTVWPNNFVVQFFFERTLAIWRWRVLFLVRSWDLCPRWHGI